MPKKHQLSMINYVNHGQEKYEKRPMRFLSFIRLYVIINTLNKNSKLLKVNSNDIQVLLVLEFVSVSKLIFSRHFKICNGWYLLLIYSRLKKLQYEYNKILNYSETSSSNICMRGVFRNFPKNDINYAHIYFQHIVQPSPY